MSLFFATNLNLNFHFPEQQFCSVSVTVEHLGCLCLLMKQFCRNTIFDVMHEV